MHLLFVFAQFFFEGFFHLRGLEVEGWLCGGLVVGFGSGGGFWVLVVFFTRWLSSARISWTPFDFTRNLERRSLLSSRVVGT